MAPAPQAEWTALRVIWGTVALELGLPVLLVWRRTRLPAVFVAGIFHAAMGMAGHVAFSAMSPILLFCFVPDDLPSRLDRLAERFPRAARGRVRGARGRQRRLAFPALASVWLLAASAKTFGWISGELFASLVGPGAPPRER